MIGRYDRLRDIIDEDNHLVTLLNRFDIALGFGDSDIQTVCDDNGVDTETFLAVVNFKVGRQWQGFNISLPSLMEYLRKSHVRFLEFTLPHIKRLLLEGIFETSTDEVAMVILRFFDEYVSEVRRHMDYEDQELFAYVENLIDGTAVDSSRIREFSDRHDNMAGKLNDLKNLFIYRLRSRNNEKIGDALLLLMECGRELKEHCDMEDRMLFPAIRRLETELKSHKCEGISDIKDDSDDLDMLTDRERDVIREITNGLSTKEIADRLCLSVHTVNTYRKNIGEKLDIHSAAGIAVYAILHHIVDLDEVTCA